jgi:hypothetical protein
MIRHNRAATSSAAAVWRMTSSPTCIRLWQIRSASADMATPDRSRPLAAPAASIWVIVYCSVVGLADRSRLSDGLALAASKNDICNAAGWRAAQRAMAEPKS